MAININDFPNDIDIGLKANKDATKFFYRFKIDGITKRGIIDFSFKTWDKRTRTEQAKVEFLHIKNKIKNPQTDLDEKIKLHTFIQMHFDKLPNTTWTVTKKKHYENYIHKLLGQKKVVDIKQMHIKDCIKKQEDLGLSPRTVKTTLEILNPVFKEAIANRLIDFNPCTGITIKIPRTKKRVMRASDELARIYNAIYSLFGDNPFYFSFYLFAMQGRRKSEILNLKWENIDFSTNEYLVEDTKNGEHQMFRLPIGIKDELSKFRETSGWVYASSIKEGSRVTYIEKQTRKLKAIVPNFTLHYMRNVIVSAMAEQGVSATLMSGALGHNNTSTLAKYLSLNYIQGSEVANQTIQSIIYDSNIDK